MKSFPIQNVALFGLLSIIATLTVQLTTESMIFGALAGIIVLSVSGSLPLKEADAILTSGMRMMSFIGFVMICRWIRRCSSKNRTC